MEQRSLGSLSVSVIGLGTNNFGFFMEPDDVPAVVDEALAVGINFFDTADAYGASEERLAAALGARRDQVVVATKFFNSIDGQPGGASPAYIAQAVERSLLKLKTDYIDLYQLHRPDADTPIGDTLAALNELVVAGKVREIGCSNFTAAQLDEAEAAVRDGAARFVSVQNQWNLLQREDESDAVVAAERLSVGYLPFFPLASGLLSGKYRRGEGAPEGTRLAKVGDRAAAAFSDRNFDIIERLTGWASDHGHSLLELALAWLMAHEVVPSVIAGATSPAQIRSNAAAAQWKLSASDVAEVGVLAR